jgi:Ni/Fe-hydrogenase subunit HybB-like protein
MRSEAAASTGPLNELRRLIPFFLGELRPKGRLLTPFNVISAPIILLGLLLVVIRFAKGLGAVTNLSQEFPWGVWIGFDVITGVAFAGGAYVLTFMVYILRAEKYRPIVRATVLNGFLAYCFYAGALLLDVGRPWHIVNPIIGNKFGVSSVMFVVAWHFMLYTMAEFVEFFPAVAEWLGWKRVRKIFGSLTLATVIFGITLSTLHQAGLGGLFLLAKSKMHPLWYSEYIPHLFFVSSIFAGLSLVIVEGSISHKVFSSRLGPTQRASHDDILVGLGRVSAGTMFVYLFMKILDLVHGRLWSLLDTPMGYWYLVEILGFVLLPGALFFQAVRRRSLNLLRVAAVLTLLGIIVNRLNVALVAFKWDAPLRYIPSWMEIEITAAVVLGEIWAFRWIVNRMPVLSDPPQWAAELDDH